MGYNIQSFSSALSGPFPAGKQPKHGRLFSGCFQCRAFGTSVDGHKDRKNRGQTKPRNKETHQQKFHGILLGLSQDCPGIFPRFPGNFVCVFPPPVPGTIPKSCLCLLASFRREILRWKGFPANFDASGNFFPDSPAARISIPAKVWALSGNENGRWKIGPAFGNAPGFSPPRPPQPPWVFFFFLRNCFFFIKIKILETS